MLKSCSTARSSIGSLFDLCCRHVFTSLALLVLLFCQNFGIFVESIAAAPGTFFPPKPSVYAIIIGIDDYSGPLQRLRFPSLDAKLVYTSLQKSRGSLTDESKAILLLNPSKDEIIGSIKSFVGKMTSEDYLLFYWAGHSSYSETEKELYLPTNELVSNSTKPGLPYKYLSIADELVKFSSKDSHIIFIGDGCNIGDGMLGRLAVEHPFFSVLSSTKFDEQANDGSEELGSSPFAFHFADALTVGGNDLDGDGLLSLEEVHHYIYPRLIKTAISIHGLAQHATVSGRFIHRVKLVKTPPIGNEFRIQGQIPDSLSSAKSLLINGQEFSRANVLLDGDNLLLSQNAVSEIRPGLNLLSDSKTKWLFWQEDNHVSEFKNPYKTSHAILVAIDNYESKGTEFPKLTKMVERSQELGNTLLSLGFPSDHIVELYNDDATSERLRDVLKSYYQGGKNEHVDRLFLYFGGHGGLESNTALLVTHDYNKDRPALSSFSLPELILQHARFINAHHMLIALDVCHAGLAAYTTLGTDGQNIDSDSRNPLAKLTLIKTAVEDRARNLLLAGTGKQKALWENGGIFTQALIKGLNGKADHDNNGIIQFGELRQFVRNQVNIKAGQTGIRQVPAGKVLDQYGEGRFLFIRGDVRESQHTRRKIPFADTLVRER
jgi:caspase domain-containing protein